MKIEQALSLLQAFSKEVDVLQPILPQLSAHFTPSILGKGVVDRRSLHGRVSIWYHATQSKQHLELKIHSLFLEAFQTLEKERSAMSQISMAHRVVLAQELRKSHSAQNPPSAPLSADLEAIQSSSNEVLKSQQQKKYEKSLLRIKCPEGRPSIDADAILNSFEMTEMTLDSIDYLIEFLKRNPTYSKPHIEEWIDLLKQGKRFENKLQESFFPNGQPIKNHRDEMNSTSLAMAEIIKDLSPGEAWLFCGSYGPKVFSWEGALQFLKLLPKDILDNLPEPLPDFVKSGKLADPVQYVENLIHEAVEELSAKTSKDFSINLSFLDSFLKNDTRKLPDCLAKIIPHYLKDPLNQRLQEGLVGNALSLLELVPSGEVLEVLQFLMDQGPLCRDLGLPVDLAPLANLSNILRWIPSAKVSTVLKWVSENIHLIDQPKQREIFIKKLESYVLSFAKKHKDYAESVLNGAATKMIQNTQETIPHQLLDLLGLENLSNGKCWVEFQRQSNNKFTVLVYGSGAAWHLHTKNETGHVQWPLRFVNVAVEKITSDLFQTLLKHHIETQRDASLPSKAEDLYKGLIEYLGGQPDFTHVIHPKPIMNEGQMVEATLIDPSVPLGFVFLKSHIEEFHVFSQPFLTGTNGLLEIRDEKSCQAFEKILKVLNKEFESLKGQFTKEEQASFEATFAEIERAILQFHTTSKPQTEEMGTNSLNLPNEWLEGIRSHLVKQGFKANDLYASKGFLIWALGDEIGDFIDAIIQAVDLEHVPPEAYIQDTPDLPIHNKGWLKSLLASVYVKMVLGVLKTLSEMLRICQFGISPLLLGRLLNRGLHYLLPEPLRSWYFQALQAIQRACMELGLHFVMHYMLSKENAEVIEKLGKTWKQTLQETIKALNNRQSIHFELSSPLPLISEGNTLQCLNPKIAFNAENPNTYDKFLFYDCEMRFAHTLSLNELNQIKEKIHSLRYSQKTRVSFYAIRALKDIPIPQKSEWMSWDEISPEFLPDYLEAVSSLGLVLNEVITDLMENKFKYYPGLLTDAICAQYNLLVLIDFLARRCEGTSLRGYQVNIGPLLRWLNHDDCYIKDPQQLKQIQSICRYFLPDIDFDHLPTEEEIQSLEKKSLFSYAFLHAFFTDPMKVDPISFETYCQDLSIPEFHYLQKMLQNPEVVDKCQMLRIKDVSSSIANYFRQDSPIDFNQLNPEQKVRILFENSLGVENANPVLPLAFMQLKRQTLLSNSLAATGFDKTPMFYSWTVSKEHLVVLENKAAFAPLAKMVKEKFVSLWMFPLLNENLKHLFQSHLISQKGYKFERGGYSFNRRLSQAYLTARKVDPDVAKWDPKPINNVTDVALAFVQDARRVRAELEIYIEKYVFQSNAADDTFEFNAACSSLIEIFTKSHEIEAFLLIRSEKSDQLLRACEFFKNHLAKLNFQNPDLLGFFEGILFRSNDLERLLNESDHFVTVINEFFSKWLACYESQKQVNMQLWVIWLWFGVYKRHVSISPNFKPAFPRFADLLNSIQIDSKSSQQAKGILKILKALYYTLPLADKGRTPEEIALIFVRTHFDDEVSSQNKRDVNLKTSNEDTFFDCIKLEFNQEYHKRIQIASHHLTTHKEARQTLVKAIAEDNRIVIPNDTGEWEYNVNLLRLRKDDIYFLITSGHIGKYSKWIRKENGELKKIDQYAPTEMLSYIKKMVVGIIPSATPIRMVENDKFATADGLYSIESFHEEEQSGNDKIFLKYFHHRDGKRYLFYPKNSEMRLELAKTVLEFDYFYDDNKGFWIEETPNPQKELLLFVNNEPKHFKIQQKTDSHSTEFYVYGFKEEAGFLELVDPQEASAVLMPIGRFCSAENVLCLKKPGENHLERLILKPFDLRFDVKKNEEGVLQAHSHDRFPGYAIASSQFFKNSHTYPSYLLLENANGQKKVLVPANDWVNTFAWRFLARMGFIGNLVTPWITAQVGKKTNAKFFDYDLDAQGNLITENPNALMHLILTFLVLGKRDQANALCASFETLCRRDKFEEDLSNTLVPLCLVPADIEGIGFIRQKILSAFEENQLLRPGKKTFAGSRSSFSNLVITLCLFADLQMLTTTKKERVRIDIYQEWFLYQGLFRRIKFLTARYFDFEGVFDFAGQQLSWDIIADALGFSPEMVKRYRELNEKLGNKESLLKKGLNFYNEVQNTQVDLSHKMTPLYEAPDLQLGNQVISFTKNAFFTIVCDQNLINLSGLKKTMSPEWNKNLPLTLSELNAASFVCNYLSYYAIARGEKSKEEKNKLKELLSLLKGGWDSQTKILVEYLNFVMQRPYLCWKSQSLKEALQQSKQKNSYGGYFKRIDRRFPLFYEFFQHLHYRTIAFVNTPQGLKLIASTIFQPILTRAVHKNSPGMNAVPSSMLFLPLVRFGEKLAVTLMRYATLKTTSNTLSASPQQQISLSSSYKGLEEEDRKVDAFLDTLFSHAFEEVPPTEEEMAAQKKVDPFEIHESNDASTKNRKGRINASIGKFYESYKGHEQTKIKLKSAESIWDLYTQLVPFRDEMKNQIERELNVLLNSVNFNVDSEKLTFNELKKAFLDGNFDEVCARSKLNPNVMQNLEMAIAKHFIKQGRLNQIEALVASIEALSQISSKKSKEKYEDKLEWIVELLKARRNYTFSELPPRLTRGFIVFEAVGKVLLWKRQVDRLKDILVKCPSASAVLEFLMSLGKTFLGMPMMDFYLADGTCIVFNTFLRQMAPTNIHQISLQGKEIFDQPTHGLFVDRSSALRRENLEAFQTLLHKAKAKKETISMTKEDAQSLELRLLEPLFYLAFPEEQTEAVDKIALKQLQKVLWKMRTEGKNVGDEAAELFEDNDELNFPIGKKLTVAQNFYLAIEHCLRCVAENPTLQKLIATNSLDTLKKLKYEEEIRIELAKQLSLWSSFEIYGDVNKTKEFIDYISDKIPKPKWIEKHAKVREIDLVKGVLIELLPLLLGKRVSVHFGDGGEGFAKPFMGNMNPLMDSIIQMIYEAVVKTFVMSLHKGLDSVQVIDLIGQLKFEACTESKRFSKPIVETKAFKAFAKLFPDCDLMTFFDSSTVNEKVQLAQHNSEVIFYYLRRFVWKKLTYWKLNLSSNALNYHSMFASGFYQTGTPYNDGCYPSDAHMLWDPTTTGEALHIIFNKCPKDGIHRLQSSSSNPSGILNEVLEKFFSLNSGFTAIIDGGGQFTGLSGDKVAKEMLEHCKAHRPDIKAVVYFEKDKQGKDHLVFLEKDATSSKPFHQCTIPPENYLSYFDQSHGFAANIPQKLGKAKGLNLIGPGVIIDDGFQHAFRLRGLKKWKRVVSTEEDEENKTKDPLEGVQEIHFAMTGEVQQEISGDRLPTRREIFEFGIRNVDLKTREENYRSYRKKVKNVIRRAFLDKILQASSVKEMVRIFKISFKVFVTILEDDPTKLYGNLRKFIPLEAKLLNQIKNEGFDSLSNAVFSKQEIETIKADLDRIPIPVMPPVVQVSFDGDQINVNVNDHLGKESTLSQQSTQNQNIEQEQDLDLNQNQNQNLQSQQANSKTYLHKEWEWDPNLEAYSTHWKIFSNGSPLSGYWAKMKQKWELLTTYPLVPLFKINDLLMQSETPVLKAISGTMDPRIWCSNNFIPRILKEMLNAPVPPGSAQQRRLFEVLIDFTEENGEIIIHSVGCLSIKDAAFWKGKLNEKHTKNESKIKRMVYNVHLGSATAGDILPIEALRNCSDLLALEAQLKFLNGETEFLTKQVPFLISWLQACPLSDMYVAAQYLVSQKEGGILENSTLDLAFEGLFAQTLGRIDGL